MKKYFYLAVICLIAIAIALACTASATYVMPERGIPL